MPIRWNPTGKHANGGAKLKQKSPEVAPVNCCIPWGLDETFLGPEGHRLDILSEVLRSPLQLDTPQSPRAMSNWSTFLESSWVK